MDGLLLVNKPIGITSFDVIRKLRRTTGVKKIGHAGTLDPLASGLMLLLFGSGTKQAASFSKLDKTYLAEITLGANSTTGDGEGELMAVSDRQPAREEVEAACLNFIGQIEQTPSIYSAIKVAGKEAYKYARKGQSVEIPSRAVTVYKLTLLDYAYPKLKIEARVSSGTYIRSLAEDIGRELGTGAFLSELVRTEVGDFKLSGAIDVDASPTDIHKRLQPLTK